jgi:hypothetical protein
MLKKTVSSVISLLVLAGANFIPVVARAESITFGPAITSGGGCRPGQQVISPDGRTISILLENFVAENGRRATCNLRIPTEVPAGFLIQTVDVTYQGFRDIQPRGFGFLKSTYSVGAQTAPGLNLNFTPGTDIFIGKAPFKVVAFSQCGLNSNIGINMNAYASRGSTVMLDSVDMEARTPDVYMVTLTFGLGICP